MSETVFDIPATPGNYSLTGKSVMVHDLSQPESMSTKMLPATKIKPEELQILSGVNAVAIKQVSKNDFLLPHGTIHAGGKIFVGCRYVNLECSVAVYSKLDDIANTVFKIYNPAFDLFEGCCYDSVRNKVYFICTRRPGEPGYDGSQQILEIDVANPATYAFHDITGGFVPGNASPAIVTDNTYIYIGSAETPDAKIYKIDIATWTVADSVVITGVEGLHAAQIFVYTDRTELYFTSTSGFFVKVNPADLSFSTLALTAPFIATDDFAYVPIDNAGGKCYVGNESRNFIAIVDTADMSAIEYPAKSCYCVGAWNGHILFSDINTQKLGVYVNGNPANVLYLDMAGYTFNEIIPVGSRLFITTWQGSDISGRLLELDLQINGARVNLKTLGDIVAYETKAYKSKTTVTETDIVRIMASRDEAALAVLANSNGLYTLLRFNGTRLEVMENGGFRRVTSDCVQLKDAVITITFGAGVHGDNDLITVSLPGAFPFVNTLPLVFFNGIKVKQTACVYNSGDEQYEIDFNRLGLALSAGGWIEIHHKTQ